ncbi:hypothetical protein GGR52DRAFT_337721 [Hypoxylon sp. FL1284]|nr:hypothetical protein GGR52DRAFT_337721 [Hypoxylon sp. FL1284]
MGAEMSDKANLKRIRDNQRRSRARRRQYIQELEVQIESHRTQGIEVAAEIQQAARRVAEQNKKMRVLLNSLGFSDERISHFLQTSNLGRSPAETMEGLNLLNGQEGSAEALELLLIPHRPTSQDSQPYLMNSPTPRTVVDNGACNDIAGILPETSAAELNSRVPLPGSTAYPAPSYNMSSAELAQHPPALVELSDAQQYIKDFQYDGSPICQEDLSYGYDVNDEDTMSYLRNLSFTPERTSSGSSGSVGFCNSQNQNYDLLEYTSMVSW